MLDGRLGTMLVVYKTYLATGIHCLMEHTGKYFLPMGATDDLGYFLYTTIFSKAFGLDPLLGGDRLFSILVCLGLAFVVFLFLFFAHSFYAKIFVVIGVLRLSMPLYHLNHVYTAYFLGCLPIPLVLVADKYKNSSILYGATFVGGFIAAFANVIRFLSALPAFVFLMIYLLGSSWPRRSKILALVFCFVGYSLPAMHFFYEMHRRDIFLKSHNTPLPDRTTHIFWHNIYTGFGFLQNNQNIEWKDASAHEAVLKVDSTVTFGSAAYDAIVKDLLIKLFKEKRYFFITTIFAKLGVVLYFFLLYFGLFGLLAAWFYPKPWYIEIAFWSALGVSVLPGILTLPTTWYLMGFITCTVLYALYSALWALKKGSRI